MKKLTDLMGAARAASLCFALAVVACSAQAQNASSVTARVTALENQVSLLQAQVNTLTSSLNALTSTVNSQGTSIGTLNTSVSKLNGNITGADLVGNYAFYGIQNELHAVSPTSVGAYVYAGTMTLNADGTGSLTGTQSGAYLNFPGSISSANNGPFTSTFNWTYSNGVVSGIPGSTISVAAGGRVLTVASANPADHTDVLLIFTRL